MIKRFFYIVFLFCLLIAGYITWFGFQDSAENADMIVVLGNAVSADGKLSPRLQARMDRAIELYKAGRSQLLFVSGGVDKQGSDEADAMRRYALSRDVARYHIVVDSKGNNTLATAENAAQFMREHKLQSALIVSQFFHLARAHMSLRRQGIKNVGCVHADYYEWRDFYSLAREVVALPVYWARLLL